jgi:hypothetical protein
MEGTKGVLLDDSETEDASEIVKMFGGFWCSLRSDRSGQVEILSPFVRNKIFSRRVIIVKLRVLSTSGLDLRNPLTPFC